MEGRGKIAFDPRDFEDGGESETVPKLEEVLLLGLKDNQVGFPFCLLMAFPTAWPHKAQRTRRFERTFLAAGPERARADLALCLCFVSCRPRGTLPGSMVRPLSLPVWKSRKAYADRALSRADNISYALRGCILIELALRRRIAMVKDPSRRRLALGDRLIEVIDDRQTGETILDEALKMIKSSEKYGAAAWVDLMSGESSSFPLSIRHRAYLSVG
jgi:hypothetical protein